MNGSLARAPGTVVRRVLIYRLGSLGDTIVALPALHLIARAYPHAERRLLTNVPITSKAPAASAILENTGLVDGYFLYTVGVRGFSDLAKLWYAITKWRPEVLIYLGSARGVASARRDEQFFKLCGIRHRIGVPTVQSMQEPLWEEVTQSFEPEASRLIRNVSSLGVCSPEDPASWELHLTPEEHARADEALNASTTEPIIAVSVGTKMQAKDWGRDNWRRLLSELAKHYPKYRLILSGAPEEREASEFAAEGWRQARGGPAINICGRLTPRESAAAFSKARIFIGHDSGPMHLAASVQTPCVAIFAARTKPRIWFPYGSQHRVVYHKTECWGCDLETCVTEKKRCLTSISVGEVMKEIQKLLG